MRAKERLIRALRSDFDGILLAAASPSEYPVALDQSLEPFLDDLKIPRWEQRLMVDHRVITVKRTAADGTVTSLRATGRSFALVRNDRVVIDRDHAPYKAQRDQMIAESKDYVLVAGSDDQDHFIVPSRDLMVLRRGMIPIDHIDAGPEGSLQQMIRAIGEVVGPDARPLNDLHIVSHAWHTGELLFAATARDARAISWESLEAAGAALQLPDEYLFNRTNPPKLIVYSCEFARAEPVMKRLRELMNPRLKVYAPKHFVGTNFLDRDIATRDYFQYMCKPAFVHAKVDLTRDQIIQDLVDRAVTDANDVTISRTRWEELVPAVPGDASPDEGAFAERELLFKMPARNVAGGVLPAIEDASFAIGGMYRWPGTVGGTLPTTRTRAEFDSDPINALKDALAAMARPGSKWHGGHRYPVWTRLQFNSANDLVDKLNWGDPHGKLNYLDGQNKIEATGWGVKYCVMVPVQAPAAASVAHGKRALRVSYYAQGAAAPHPDDLALTSSFWQSIG